MDNIFPLSVIFRCENTDELEERERRRIILTFQFVAKMVFGLRKKQFVTVVNIHPDEIALSLPRCPTDMDNMVRGSVFIETLISAVDMRNLRVTGEDVIAIDETELDTRADASSEVYGDLDVDDIDNENLELLDIDDGEWNMQLQPIKPVKITKMELNNTIKNEIAQEAIAEQIKNKKELVEAILKIINKERRLCDYDAFIFFTGVIFNCSERLKNVLKDYCEDTVYIEHCNRVWDEYMEQGAEHEYGFSLLRKWAIEDNKEKAIELFRSNTQILAKTCLAQGASDAEIATIFYNLYCDKFICSDTSSSPKWWRFQHSTWNEMTTGISPLRTILINKIRPLFKQLTIEIANGRNKIEDAHEKERTKFDFMREKAVKLEAQLGTQTFKNNILKEAADMFFDEEFNDKIDKQTKYFAFKNKVFNCETCEFEEPNPYHYLTKSTGYDYIDFDWDHDDVKWWFDNYINLVFPPDHNIYNGKIAYNEDGDPIQFRIGQKIYVKEDKKLIQLDVLDTDCEPIYQYREFIFMFLASSMHDGAIMKKYLIFRGDTNNGKSVLNKIITFWLGRYKSDTPQNLLLSKGLQQQGTASPGWFQIKGSKLTVLSEPSNDATFNDANFKILTSGGMDHVGGARDLFMKGSDSVRDPIIYRGLGVCFTNYLPGFNGSDKALQERNIVCPLVTKWDENAPETHEERCLERHFQKDPNFEKECEKRKQSFAWIMVQYFKKFKSHMERYNSLKMPQIVEQATKSYITRNDTIRKYIEDRVLILSPTDENGAKLVGTDLKIFRSKNSITVSDMYKDFKLWFDDKFPGSKTMPDQGKFESLMASKNLKPYKMHYRCLRFKS